MAMFLLNFKFPIVSGGRAKRSFHQKNRFVFNNNSHRFKWTYQQVNLANPQNDPVLRRERHELWKQ